MSFLNTLFGKGPSNKASQFEILRDDGLRAMQMGEMPYAEKCLLAALQLREDAQTQSYLAEVYLRMERHDQALPLLETLAKQADAPVDVRLLLAQTQGELKLWADERTTCQALQEELPDDARVLYLLAEAEYGLDDAFGSIAHLTQSLELRPDYRHPRWLRAQILADMKQWNEVLADVQPLVESDAENASYLMLRAEALASLQQPEAAVQDLEQVLSLNPYQREAVLALGALYEQGSRWDKALALYDEAIELQPDFAAAYKARGGVKLHLKDELGAAEDLKRTLELAPEKAAGLSGEYTNVENEFNAQYRRMNPYGF